MIHFQNKWLVVKEEAGYTFCEQPMSTNSAGLLIEMNSKIVLVKVLRMPLNKISLEIPRGTGDLNETSADCALREGKEETGLDILPDQLTLLGKVHPENGILSAHLNIYHAFLPVEQPLLPTDADEIKEILAVSRSDLFHLIATNQITDAFTLSALMMLLAKEK